MKDPYVNLGWMVTAFLVVSIVAGGSCQKHYTAKAAHLLQVCIEQTKKPLECWTLTSGG